MMIKRPEHSSTPPNVAPPTDGEDATTPSSPIDDGNGKYKRHASPLGAIQRWLALNGKLVVILILLPFWTVFLIPPLKLALQDQQLPSSTVVIMELNKQQQQSQPKPKEVQPLQIPPCPSSPWKANETLQGKCPGDLKPNPSSASISTCASSCCENAECISWQYRSDVGCLQGKDIRLGMEKDGPAAWCSDYPPHKWQGQYLKPHNSNKQSKQSSADPAEIRKIACDVQTWNPNEQIGQCFGLGDVKQHASASAEACMMACCKDQKCGAWQWTKALGCFYSKGMHGCQRDDGDPVKFEPFVGRRKFLEGRKYTDKHNKPWQQTLD